MTTFLSDTFTDADGTLLDAHTPDAGSTWVKLGFQAGGGSSTQAASINTNHLRSNSSTTNSVFYRNDADPTQADYAVQADATVALALGSALAGRMTSTGTTAAAVDCYILAIGSTGGGAAAGFLLKKQVSGAQTTLVTGATSDNMNGTVKLELLDSAKTVYLNGVSKGSSADNAITQIGRAGISCNGHTTNTYYWDNLSAFTVAAATGQPTMLRHWPRYNRGGARARFYLSTRRFRRGRH